MLCSGHCPRSLALCCAGVSLVSPMEWQCQGLWGIIIARVSRVGSSTHPTSLLEPPLNSIVMKSIITNSIITLLTPTPFPPSPAREEICNMEPGLSIALVTRCIHYLKEISSKGVRKKVESAVATGGNTLSWELTDFPSHLQNQGCD